MNSINIIKALSYRAWLGTVGDQGRLTEMLIYPLSHLAIWGLFLYAGIVDQKIAEQLFFINLVWAITMAVQIQSNRIMLADFWSREFPELFRSGVTEKSYLVADLFFGFCSGMTTIVLFFVLTWGCFDFSSDSMMTLIYTFPSYIIFSLALAIFAIAVVVRLSQTYGFIAFTLLTLILTFSSPYCPVDNLPVILKYIALISPLGLIFEYIRNGDVTLLYYSTAISVMAFIASYIFYIKVFKRLREKGDFFNL